MVKIVKYDNPDNPADWESRNPHESSSELESDNFERLISHVAVKDIPDAITLKQLQEKIDRDFELQKLKKCVQIGNIQGNALPKYKKVSCELSIVNGLIIIGEHIVIPQRLRSKVTDLMHEGHMGIVRTKMLVRSRV